MPKFAAALFIVSLGFFPAVVVERSPEVLKCPSRGGPPEMPASIILLDNEVFDGKPEDLAWGPGGTGVKLNNPVAIHSLEVVCWRWVEANYGIRVRSGASYTLTRVWVERTRRDRIALLEAVVASQDRHRELTGEYAASVADLPGFGAFSDYGLPGHLQLDLTRTADGWAARLVAKKSWTSGPFTQMSPVYDCRAYAGKVPAGWEATWADAEVTPEPRTPFCFQEPVE